jgi:hypothetical protein
MQPSDIKRGLRRLQGFSKKLRGDEQDPAEAVEDDANSSPEAQADATDKPNDDLDPDAPADESLDLADLDDDEFDLDDDEFDLADLDVDEPDAAVADVDEAGVANLADDTLVLSALDDESGATVIVDPAVTAGAGASVDGDTMPIPYPDLTDLPSTAPNTSAPAPSAVDSGVPPTPEYGEYSGDGTSAIPRPPDPFASFGYPDLDAEPQGAAAAPTELLPPQDEKAPLPALAGSYGELFVPEPAPESPPGPAADAEQPAQDVPPPVTAGAPDREPDRDELDAPQQDDGTAAQSVSPPAVTPPEEDDDDFDWDDLAAATSAPAASAPKPATEDPDDEPDFDWDDLDL